MVKRKDNLLGDKDFEEIRKARQNKETRYSVSVRYRDGGLDKYHGIRTVKIEDNCLLVYEGVSTTYIVLDIVSFFKIEEEEE